MRRVPGALRPGAPWGAGLRPLQAAGHLRQPRGLRLLRQLTEFLVELKKEREGKDRQQAGKKKPKGSMQADLAAELQAIDGVASRRPFSSALPSSIHPRREVWPSGPP